MKPESMGGLCETKAGTHRCQGAGVRQLALLTEQLQTLQAFVGQQTLLAQKQKEESERAEVGCFAGRVRQAADGVGLVSSKGGGVATGTE
jgi:hypothetical protein